MKLSDEFLHRVQLGDSPASIVGHLSAVMFPELLPAVSPTTHVCLGEVFAAAALRCELVLPPLEEALLEVVIPIDAAAMVLDRIAPGDGWETVRDRMREVFFTYVAPDAHDLAAADFAALDVAATNEFCDLRLDPGELGDWCGQWSAAQRKSEMP